MFCITKSSRSSLHSLVDRGANGGVTGRDVRFIEAHLDCKGDIRDIDDHEITSIPLVTERGVSSTITGEAALTMH